MSVQAPHRLLATGSRPLGSIVPDRGFGDVSHFTRFPSTLHRGLVALQG